ncbi:MULTISPECIES: hypothetical protein [Agathobacter]|uniref:Flagellar basal body-associated protein FliL n=1 Tax=Agathobacter ruminis TaxID=1712665 RepID=A0A2G3E3E9_9FIRM|nr:MULTISPECIES: hypothetical protein [Agathobacter]MBQ1682238.1 flagellar basal body-associated protein FliL [Agathobacter sp.]MDC7302634.1 flagellar basal body-associated protein FliL [Agathobacter ruminis]PHU37806.1 flagellar basal body-associated protein FliL [Agathobacter ruminis]
MKKNLMSVLILVLCLVNLVFNALIVFTILPQSKQLNNMITDVCQAINLNLKSGSAVGADSVPADQITVYKVLADGEKEQMTVSVKDGVCVFAASLSLNNNSENASKFTVDVLTSQNSIIASTIQKVVAKYTCAELKNVDSREDIIDEILVDMQDMYGKDYVISVNLSSVVTSP